MPNCQITSSQRSTIRYGQHSAMWRVVGAAAEYEVCDVHLPDVVTRADDFTLTALEVQRYALCSRCGSSVQRYLPIDSTESATVDNCDSCPPQLRGRYIPTQVGESEATTVAINPQTGAVSYYAMTANQPLPETLRSQGYERVQFRHTRHLEQFSRSQGVVNDWETGGGERGEYENESQFVEARERHRRRVDEASADVRSGIREARERGIPLRRSR
jgi:hypothetical protein